MQPEVGSPTVFTRNLNVQSVMAESSINVLDNTTIVAGKPGQVIGDANMRKTFNVGANN